MFTIQGGKAMKKKNKYSVGFSITELAIVIAVIGILAAVLIPTFSKVIDDANAKSALSDARNIVEKYNADTFGKSSKVPQNMLIAIYKADSFYLFGYDRLSGGSLQISEGNPYSGYDDFSDLVKDWSFNSKHSDLIPESQKEYDPEVDGTFYMVPYDQNGNNATNIKAFGEASYKNLGQYMNGSFGSENQAVAYHGFLLGGTFTVNESDDSSPSGYIDDREEFTISFNAGELEGDGNVVLPESVIVKDGDIFIPGRYNASYTTGAYRFAGWDIYSSFTVRCDVVLTATWEQETDFKLTFNAGTGDNVVVSLPEGEAFIGWENGNELPAGLDITELVNLTTAEKEGKTFVCWIYKGERYPNGSPIYLSHNITFTAAFDDDTAVVTINPNNGIDAEERKDVTVGSTITLPLGTEYTAPEGKIFGYWTSSLENDNNQYAAGAANISVTSDVTFTAHWVEPYFYVEYTQDVPQKAQAAGIQAVVPESARYDIGTESVNIGGATLAWYNTANYSTSLGGMNLPENSVIDTSMIEGGTIYITPNYSAKTAQFEYSANGYVINENLPTGGTYDLVEIKDGYTVSTYNLTCEECYKFVGWCKSDEPDTTYIPGSTFAVTEALEGTKITFVPKFDETVIAMKTINFKFWDYQNYAPSSMSSHVFETLTLNVPIGITITADMFFEGDGVTPRNMPTQEFSISRAGGFNDYNGKNSYEGYYSFAKEAAVETKYNGATVAPVFTPIEITDATVDNSDIYIPTYRYIDIGADKGFKVITTELGLKNIDRGYTGTSGVYKNESVKGNSALANDIAFTAETTPIGYAGKTNPVNVWDNKGIFDGLGYKVSAFTFNHHDEQSAHNYVGLFAGNAAGAVIRNVKIDATAQMAGDNYVGCAAGINEGTIENVAVTVSIQNTVKGKNRVGGICGENSGTIKNCHVVSSADETKQIVSTAPGSEHLQSPLTGTVSGVFLGGITGFNNAGTISQCSVGGGEYSVGINADSATLDNTNGIGGIAGIDIGGVIDRSWVYNTKLNRNYSSDDAAQFANLRAVGGIAGIKYGGTVQHCWANNIQLTTAAAGGGICGLLTSSATIKDCWIQLGTSSCIDSTTVGDVVASGSMSESCTVVDCAIWGAVYTDTICEGASDFTTLSDKNPAEVGLNAAFYYKHVSGPQLTTNVFCSSWNF